MNSPFEIVKQAEIKLDIVPAFASVESPQFDSVTLDAEHQRLLGWLASKGLGEWDSKDCRLNTHTDALKRAHEELGLKGTFETSSTGSTERNCFAYPKPNGAWFVCRYGQNVQEHPSWRKSQGGWTCCDFNKKASPKTKDDPAAIIVSEANEQFEFFHDQNGLAYATARKDGWTETLLVKDPKFSLSLRMIYTNHTSKVAKSDWIKNAQEQLQAIAILESPEFPVFVRLGEADGKIYLDLANSRYQFAEISKDGWEVIEKPPIRFRRPATMLSLPVPQLGGTHEMLQPFFNVRASDWPALLGFMVMCFNPFGPFPCLVLSGRSGSGKTLTARNVMGLVDPCEIEEGGTQPETVEDLMIAAKEGRVLFFDNMSRISPEMSDAYCRALTGGTLARRKKYSDAGQTVFRAKQPIVMTAISNPVRATDLLDRAMPFEVPILSARKAEAKFKQDFEKVRPQGLGVLLNGVVAALRNQDSITIANPPRLFDFAVFGAAAEEGLGIPKGSFMASYRANLSDTRDTILDTELARQIIELAGEGFLGTASDLAKRLEWNVEGDAELKAKVGELRKLAPALEGEGIHVEFHPKAKKKRLIEIRRLLAGSEKSCSLGDESSEVPGAAEPCLATAA